MTLSLEQISARMRQGEDIPLSDTARIALTPVSYTHLTLPNEH